MTLRIFLVEDNKTIRDSLIPALEDLASAEAVGQALMRRTRTSQRRAAGA